MDTLQAYHDYHSSSVLDRQLHLNDLIGESDWQFDMEQGKLAFGQTAWKCQVLGTESDATQSWMWSWANSQSGIPGPLLTCVLSMKDLGTRKGLPELANPTLSLAAIDGHFLSIVSAGECKANAYYRGPYQGGAVYLLIRDDRYPFPVEKPLLRIAHVFPQALSVYGVQDHRLALMGHLDYYGLSHESRNDEILCSPPMGGGLRARFQDKLLMELAVT